MFEKLKKGDKIICVEPFNYPIVQTNNLLVLLTSSWKNKKIYTINEINVYQGWNDVIFTQEPNNQGLYRCTIKKLSNINKNGNITNLGKEYNFKQ